MSVSHVYEPLSPNPPLLLLREPPQPVFPDEQSTFQKSIKIETCITSVLSGLAASVLLENPLPLLIGLSECFPRVSAQQKVGNEFQVNTYTTDDQRKPSVASFSNGNFVVTWEGRGQGDISGGIYGQLFDGNRTKIGSEFRVNSYTTNEQRKPSVASFSNGNFVVTWESYGQDGDNWGVYGQLFDGNAAKIGSEFRANSFTIGEQWFPSVASFSSDNFVVTWESRSQDGSGFGVYGYLFDGNGTKIGNEFLVNSYTSNAQRYPSGTSFSNGNFVVTWTSSGQDGSGYGVYGQLFNGNGTKIGSEFRVNSYVTRGQRFPSVARLADGNFVVTWESDGQDGDNWGVYGQLFDGNGSKIGREFRANSFTNLFQANPSVASFSNGNFVVTWESESQVGLWLDIYGQLFDGNAAKIGNEFRANSYTTDWQWSPSVANLADGNFVVTWQSNGQDGSDYGVYGQIFNDFPVSSTTSTTTSSTTSSVSSSTTVSSSSMTTSSTTSSVSSSTTVPSSPMTTSSMTSSVSSCTTVSSSSMTTSSTTSNVSSSTMSAIGRTRTSVIPSSSSRTTVSSTTAPASSTRLASSIISNPLASPAISTSPKSSRSILWISLGVSGLVCFCVTPLGLFLLRKRKSQTGAHLFSGESSTAFELKPVVQRHKVIGEAYYQLSTLVQEEAEEIYLQTGHLILFPAGQKKFSYVIGSGKFGKIKVAQRIEGKQYVASKKVKGEENMRASEAEAQMQQAAAGDNVLPIYNTIHLEDALYHFMPLAGLGDGSTIQQRLALLDQSPLALTILLFIAQNILTGLKTMHTKGIYHLDIKPDNIVFTKNGNAYITDFGCAQRPKNRHLTGTALGDNRYFSPERLRACREGTFDAEKADMWAAGVTLLQILYNKDPLELLHMPHRLAARVERCDPTHFDEQLQRFSEVQEGSIWWVIKGLLHTNPKTRFTARGALQAHCFQGLDPTQQERAFEDLRRETFAQHERIEKSEINLGDYGWVMQRVPEEERTQGYRSEIHQQFYGYTLTPDFVPANYQHTPDHVTASSASSGYQLTP